MRTSALALDPELKKEIYSLFPQLVADIKTSEDATAFLHDFLTEKEFQVFAKRLAILYWLKKGKSYQQIKDEIKVSSATIASVQNSLNRPGIVLAIKLLQVNEWATNVTSRLKRIVRH